MANLLSSITSVAANDILSLDTASGSATSSPATTSSAGPLTSSDLPVSTPNVVSTNVSPALLATGTDSTSSTTTLLPSTSASTASTSSTIILTSSSPTSIPKTSTSSTFSSTTPISSTSATHFESASSSVSPTGSANVVLTTVVTVVSGTTITTVIPTTLITSPSADVVSRRTAAIAGATTGFVALFLIALGVVFWYRRHKLRKVLESTGKKKEGRSLLDGEEFDDDERNISNSMQSNHYPTHVSSHEGPYTSLNLMKSRTSESGSIFREEVWPPPGFIDPILRQNSQVDLSVIVDDVMGTSSYESAGPSARPQEPLQPTDESSLSAISSTSTSSLITPPSPPSPSSSTYVASTSLKLSLPPPPSVRSLNSQPRKSSPLARTSMNESKLWLTRNVRHTALP